MQLLVTVGAGTVYISFEAMRLIHVLRCGAPSCSPLPTLLHSLLSMN
uniref:Uncharacterized protein n=1 Tax=Anguilla anguilla TaxID=7936 RepID=A0A0E9RPP4_ANGAN